MKQFQQARVLVTGDVMLDRYWEGATRRISPEAPVPVVHINNTYEKAGGAGNVALNISALQGQATILSLVGQDDAAQHLNAILKKSKVNNSLLQANQAPTICKLRLLSQNQQLIRADFENHFQQEDLQQIPPKFAELITGATAVVVSDYGKGTLKDIPALITKAKQHNIPVLVDPKSKDFSLYHGATLITPNYQEFIAAVGPCDNETQIIEKAHGLIAAHQLGGLLITRGAEGMTLVRPNQEAESIPTRAKEVYDVTGAGDTVIAVMALAIGTGCDWVTSMHYANAAASVVVGKIGTATVTPEELNQSLHKIEKLPTGMMNEAELKKTLVEAKQQGEKIVMTNGCFDLLHAGHVDYLKTARAAGDRLIVAVNDDASVQHLKGPTRPINTLEQRMQVLTALESVDWVVPFSEETPERLITELMPDVLIKGADYAIEDIAGSKQVLANGGEVKTIALMPDCSTSHIIQKIRE